LVGVWLAIAAQLRVRRYYNIRGVHQLKLKL
jgi:hypothetical protein